MRIDKFFSDLGMFSRREIKDVIKSRRVKINGVIAKSPSDNVNAKTDKVFLDGTEVFYSKYFYYVFNKPVGVVTATTDKTERTIFEFLPQDFLSRNIVPVGRLDKDTSGLLILTNDGDFCHKLTSPKHNVEKEYCFKLAQNISKEDVKSIENGLTLKDGLETKPCKIVLDDDFGGHIIIAEGKYHQVRRMFGAVNNRVVELKRVREGKVLIDNLKECEYRQMTNEEINSFNEKEK